MADHTATESTSASQNVKTNALHMMQITNYWLLDMERKQILFRLERNIATYNGDTKKENLKSAKLT
jgi:hypothetical protein